MGRMIAREQGWPRSCPTLTACLALAFLLAVLTDIPWASAGDPEAEGATLEQFERQWTEGRQGNDDRSLEELASRHRTLLRPAAEAALDRFLQSTRQGDSLTSREMLLQAESLAGYARYLSHDKSLILQVRQYRSWTSDQLSLKHRADEQAAAARVAFGQGSYGEAVQSGKAAVALHASLSDMAGENDALHILGQARRKRAEYAEARTSHERARRLGEKAQDRLRQGRALVDLGDVYERQKNRTRAVELYKQALAVLKLPEEWRETGRALRQLGDVYVALGRFEDAYRTYSQALTHATEAQDPIYQSECHDYLGYFYRRLGDCLEAIKQHQESLENAYRIRAIDARVRAQARALNHLGLCKARLAEIEVSDGNGPKARDLYRAALVHEEQALSKAEEGSDRWRQGYILRALALFHRDLGKLLGDDGGQGEYQRSITRADQALTLALAMQEKEWEGLALHQRAMTQALLGQDAEGLETLQKAIAIWEVIGDLQSMAYAYRLMARDFHEPRGRWSQASAAYESALNLSRKLRDMESQASTLSELARLNGRQGRVAEAAALYMEAFASWEKVRARSGLPEFKKAFMERVREDYEEAAVYMLDHGMADRAFRYVEGVKARAFLDQLAESRVDLKKGIDPGMRRKRDDLERSIADIGDLILAEYRRQPPDEGRIASLKSRHDRLSAELEALTREIRLKNPLYASVQYPKPIDMATLQKAILRKEEILLEYFLCSRGLYCFAVTPGRWNVFKLATGPDETQDLIAEILQQVKGLQSGAEKVDPAPRQRLYRILLQPMETWIRGKTLIIVPDGNLARLPFEMLLGRDDQGEFRLLERYRIKYIQSASVLGLLRTQYRKTAPKQDFIGFGDPVYASDFFQSPEPDKGDPQRDGPSRGLSTQVDGMKPGDPVYRLSRLPGSAEEIREIGRTFKEAQRRERELLRTDARERYAKSNEMERYGYIHFAAHGIITDNFQAIALSQIPGSQEDGLLTLGEIMNCRYGAQLVVLSACETGLGRMVRGEGVVGLTRAVMYAGSPAVLVSLWSVSDEGTKELMIGFYRNLIRLKIGKEEALRRAKLAMLETPYDHPFFWAAFVMYGE
jgi:CHAT domain-containing protein